MALLIVLSTLSMAWFFSANSAALDGLNRLPDNVRVIVNDTQLFIDNTENELRYVTNNNLNEFMKNIDNDIIDVSDNLTGTIDGAIEDIHFYQMVNISTFLSELAIDFHDTRLDEWKLSLKKLLVMVEMKNNIFRAF